MVQPYAARSRDPMLASHIIETCRVLTLDVPQAGGTDRPVVWPEGGTPFSLNSRHAPVDESFRTLVTVLATSLHTQILLNDYLFEGQDEFNNMYLVSRSGAIIDNYKKMFLLAFGEYIPFSDRVPFLRGLGGIGT